MSRYLILLLVPVACAAPDVTPPPPEPSVEVAAAEQPAPRPTLELPRQERVSAEQPEILNPQLTPQAGPQASLAQRLKDLVAQDLVATVDAPSAL